MSSLYICDQRECSYRHYVNISCFTPMQAPSVDPMFVSMLLVAMLMYSFGMRVCVLATLCFFLSSAFRRASLAAARFGWGPTASTRGSMPPAPASPSGGAHTQSARPRAGTLPSSPSPPETDTPRPATRGPWMSATPRTRSACSGTAASARARASRAAAAGTAATRGGSSSA